MYMIHITTVLFLCFYEKTLRTGQHYKPWYSFKRIIYTTSNIIN